MTDVVDGLQRIAQDARKAHPGGYYIGENVNTTFKEVADKCEEAAAEIERLRSQLSSQWCDDMSKAPKDNIRGNND